MVQALSLKFFSLGSSIAVSRHPLPGTLGGYLFGSVRKGKQRLYGLINNHVANVCAGDNQQGKCKDLATDDIGY